MLCDRWRRVCSNTQDLDEDGALYSSVHAWNLVIAKRLITEAFLAISQRLVPSFTVTQLSGGDSELGRFFILRYIRSGVCGWGSSGKSKTLGFGNLSSWNWHIPLSRRGTSPSRGLRICLRMHQVAIVNFCYANKSTG
jgi:hypothetical protein